MERSLKTSPILFLQLFEILVEKLSAFFDTIANYFSNKHASIDGIVDNSPIGFEAFVSFSTMTAFGKSSLATTKGDSPAPTLTI